MYEPPKLNTMFKNASEIIDAKLKIARTTPVIEIQFLMVEGNFMRLYFTIFTFGFTMQVCKNYNIYQYVRLIYIPSIYA